MTDGVDGNGPGTDGTAPADGYRLDDQIGFLLRRAHQRATAIFQTTIGDNQITPTQFAALAKLFEIGEVSQNRLGRLTAMDPATIQGVTRRLTDRGLLTSRPDRDDKRRMLLCLTEEGRELIRSLFPSGAEISRKTLDKLDAAERAQLIDFLKRLA